MVDKGLSMVHSAIILAAGVGSRLKPYTDSVPKPLVEVNGQSILDYQINTLGMQKEIEDIFIVTGYRGEMIEDAVEKNNTDLDITIIQNEEYETTNNMYSLLLALRKIDINNRNLLLMNGDVICDSQIVHRIVHNDEKNLIAVDKGSYLDESMKVVISNGKLARISKDVDRNSAYGISIDLYKFSASATQSLKDEIESIISSGKLNQWVEVAIDSLLCDKRYPASPLDLNGRPWWEIDTPRDLEIAESLFRKETELKSISKKSVFIFDLDGTLILGNRPIEGARELVRYLRTNEKEIVIVTNNSSRGIEETSREVSNALNLKVPVESIFSSTHSTIHYLNEENISRVYAVGTKAFVSDLMSAGIQMDSSDPEVVVIAFDTQINYNKIRRASLLIQKGKPFIATHADQVCPTNEGFIPDAGSILALFRTATGRKPDRILGKPSPEFIERIAQARDVASEEMMVIGDRLHTDIKMGLEAGCTTAVVLSGDTQTAKLGKSPYLPDYVFYNVGELLNYLKISGG